jgi:hypothetical protein
MAMFEQELEMEKRESSIVPLLLIVALILVVVGVAGYYIVQNRKVLTLQEATGVATAVLQQQGPATLEFHTGLVKASVNDSAHGPHYRLLEKAGLLTIGKDQGQYLNTTPVALTAKGEELLKQISGVTQSKEKDGTELYLVPVAYRKLATVSDIKMINPNFATVDLTWNWETNQLGEIFDAAGPLVKSFNTWDRATLIDKHSANFYHGAATKVTLTLAKKDNGWQIATE